MQYNNNVLDVTTARIALRKPNTSPENVLLANIMEGASQYWSAKQARAVKEGQKKSALQHKHLGGTPPLGYDVNPETREYVINEAEAPTVRIIFKKYAEGMNYSQLIQYLNEKGCQTRQGGQFGRSSLKTILTNEKYVGTYVYHDYREENAIPAIVDQKTFDAVQTKLAVK